MGFFETEEQRKVRDLKRQMDYERYQHEQKIHALNTRIKRNAEEWEQYATAEHEDVGSAIQELRDEQNKLKQFLSKKFQEEWHSFETKEEWTKAKRR